MLLRRVNPKLKFLVQRTQPNKIVGRERNQRACHRHLVCDVAVSRRVNSIVMLLSAIMNQPRIEAQITFLPASEGGRNDLPTDFSEGKYRPHVVIANPNQGRRCLLTTSRSKPTWVWRSFMALLW